MKRKAETMTLAFVHSCRAVFRNIAGKPAVSAPGAEMTDLQLIRAGENRAQHEYHAVAGLYYA